MKKDICIIAANCQGAYLKSLLSCSPEFNARFEIHYFVNYNHETVPMPLLKRCKLLIYQPLGPKWGDLASPKLLRRVGEGCKSISVNYLTFPVYWPFMAHDKRNVQDKEYPFGQFPYGDSLIIEKLGAGEPPERIIEDYLSEEFMASRTSPEAILNAYIEKQKDLEERRDQKVLDYVLENFRRIKLFETFNHPSRPLCIYQTNDLLARLGMGPLDPSHTPQLPYLRDNEQPIHPYVAKAFGLAFEARETTVYNVWTKPMSFIDYTRSYINWDVSAIGKTITMAPEDKSTTTPAVRKATSPPARPTMHQEQLIFLHIPKTAGSSLNKMLSEAYGVRNPETGKFIHYNSTFSLVKDAKRRERPVILGHIHYDSIQVLSPSHKVITFLRDPIERTISAFEFMKSHPEVWLGKLAQGTIAEFLSHPNVAKLISNVQVRLLGSRLNFKKLYADRVAGRINEEQYYQRIQDMPHDPVDESTLENAKERLKKLDFVGFTDTFDDDARNLFAMLNKPCKEVARVNQTPSQFKKRDKYTAEELELVASINALDSQLYAFAKELRNSKA